MLQTYRILYCLSSVYFVYVSRLNNTSDVVITMIDGNYYKGILNEQFNDKIKHHKKICYSMFHSNTFVT